MRSTFKHINERFLRHIWSRQYLRGTELSTTDGHRVEVIEPGEFNTAGGADFSSAAVRIGGTVYRGDVEIHRTVAEWMRHGHQNDPRYNTVILHVVLESGNHAPETRTQSGRTIPLLVLEPFLSESIRSLWQKTILDERKYKAQPLACRGKNGSVPAETLSRWLEKLSAERLELKLRRFEDRLREIAAVPASVYEKPTEYGEPPEEIPENEIPLPGSSVTSAELRNPVVWKQIVYEGVLDGLGYSRNREPFGVLARLVPLARLLPVADDKRAIEAALFHASGLLPSPAKVADAKAAAYVRGLHSALADARGDVRVQPMEAEAWQFFPLRPANFPTVRIAAAAAIAQKMVGDSFFPDLIQAFKNRADAQETIKTLAELLNAETDPFWKKHCKFDAATPAPVAPLGISRKRDIIINTFIPVALLYARVFNDRAVRRGVLALFRGFPPLAENGITRIMSMQVFGKKAPLDSVGKQQAAIQLYRFYCTAGRCSDCAVGKIVFS